MGLFLKFYLTSQRKKIFFDLRFTVMADCIRIGNKAARQMGSQRQRRSSDQLFLTWFSRETNAQL